MFKSTGSSAKTGNTNIEHKCANEKCGQRFFISPSMERSGYKCPHCGYSAQ